MDFVAIDFETANEKRNSPCSIGIVIVKGGQVVEKIHYLIKPKEMRFMPINIGIHGIRPAMVKDEPEFNHHDALADALACSNILLNISEELETKDIMEISKFIGVTLGTVNKDGYTPSSTKGRVLRTSGKIFSREIKNDNYNFDAFKDEVIVFTGGLGSMSREEASRLVRKLGGSIGSSVTKKTTILITNTKDIESLQREEMSIKLRKAVDLRAKGQNIIIMNEDEFLLKCK